LWLGFCLNLCSFALDATTAYPRGRGACGLGCLCLDLSFSSRCLAATQRKEDRSRRSWAGQLAVLLRAFKWLCGLFHGLALVRVPFIVAITSCKRLSTHCSRGFFPLIFPGSTRTQQRTHTISCRRVRVRPRNSHCPYSLPTPHTSTGNQRAHTGTKLSTRDWTAWQAGSESAEHKCDHAGATAAPAPAGRGGIKTPQWRGRGKQSEEEEMSGSSGRGSSTSSSGAHHFFQQHDEKKKGRRRGAAATSRGSGRGDGSKRGEQQQQQQPQGHGRVAGT